MKAIVVAPEIERIRTLRDRAFGLLGARRYIEAMDAFRTLVEATPADANAWYNLGYLLQTCGRPADALSAYEQAIALKLDRVEEAHLNKASILSDYLARPESAKRELEAALAIDREYLPALVNLARLEEQLGRREAARLLYERALQVDPRHPLALARIVGVHVAQCGTDPLIVRLRDALRDPRYSARDRAELGFGLGKALDDAQCYDEAFEAYRAANSFSRQAAGPRWRGYDRAGHEAWVRRLPDAFDLAESAGDAGGTEEQGPSLIFICGMFRSGTTLAEAILAAHPRVTAGGELQLLPQLARSLWARGAADSGVQLPRLEDARRQYLGAVTSMYPDAQTLTDKRPDNFLYIGLIKRLFPHAKIVNTVRDPRDNCLSIFFADLDPSLSYALDLMDTAHWYGLYQDLMEEWKRRYAHDILDLRYEDLLEDLRGQIGRLLRFVNLPWDDSCMHFHEARHAIQTPSAWQVRQPLYGSSAGRWKNYSQHIEQLSEVLCPASCPRRDSR